MRIRDPDFYPSRIPDPTTATKEEGGKYLPSNFFSVLWIRIGFKADSDFLANVDSDPAYLVTADPDPMTKNWGENVQFLIKNWNYSSHGIHKGRPSYKRGRSSIRRECPFIQNF
jgi:hypothetical protein